MRSQQIHQNGIKKVFQKKSPSLEMCFRATVFFCGDFFIFAHTVIQTFFENKNTPQLKKIAVAKYFLTLQIARS